MIILKNSVLVNKHKTKRKVRKEYFGLMLLGAGILLYLGRDQIKNGLCSLNSGFAFCEAQLGEVSGAIVGGPGFINKLYGPEGYGGPGKIGGGCTNTQIVQGTCSPAKAQ